MRFLYRYRLALAVLAAFPLTGCLFRSHKVEQPVNAVQLQTATQQQLEKAKAAAQPRDIADIIVCEPFTIRVKPVEKK